MNHFASPPPPKQKANESTRLDSQPQRSHNTIFSPSINLASPSEGHLNQSKIMEIIHEQKAKFNTLSPAPPFSTPKNLLPDPPLDYAVPMHTLADEQEKQLSFVLKRLLALEKEVARRHNEETLLEMQQDLLRVKTAQMEQHDVLADQLRQSEVMQQLIVVQDRLSVLEQNCMEQNNKYAAKQAKVEQSLNALGQKILRLETQQESDSKVFEQKVREVQQHSDILSQLKGSINKDIDDLALERTRQSQSIQNFKEEVGASVQALHRQVASLDKVDQLEEDLLKVINYTRDIQNQIQTTNRTTLRLKDQMASEMQRVHQDILDKTMKYKSKIYQRIQHIQDIEAEP